MSKSVFFISEKPKSNTTIDLNFFTVYATRELAQAALDEYLDQVDVYPNGSRAAKRETYEGKLYLVKEVELVG